MMDEDLNAITRSLSAPVPQPEAITRTVMPEADPGATRTDAGEPAPYAGRPDHVPGYVIQKELGRGGMGVVYLALQEGLNRHVALKMVLSGGHASATERVRFLAEAEAVASIQHPGIVQVFDFGTHSGQPFFAMEFCPGGSLAAKLDGTPLAAKDAASIVIRIARAMHAAHEKGIIHRDLKPSNILLHADGSPKVTDFGLARKSDSGSGLTQTGAILGSPSYMSPEQAEGKHDLVGIPSDVYSLGAILYECLTGRPPFRAATPLDTVMQVIKEEPVPPSRLAAKIPRDLDTIALKCLSKEPGKRYALASDLADDLQRYLNGEPIVARPAGILEKYWKSLKRRPVLHGMVILTAVSIGASLGVLNASNRNLRKKQEELEKETLAARTAEKVADEQKALAAARLEKALEAVETVMVRVAGERWANRPELQADRKEVLEQAVAFFRTMGEVESQDPAVRAQTARAHLYAATAYISLGDYPSCIESTTACRKLYQGLYKEFPDQTRFLRGEAEATQLEAHVDSIRAKFTDALTKYEAVRAMGETLVQSGPEVEENQILLAEAYSSLALFYSFQRPELSQSYHQKCREVGEKLLSRGQVGFKSRLVYASATVNLAAIQVNRRNYKMADQLLDEANEQLKRLSILQSPSARASEQFHSLKVGSRIYRGLIRVRTNKIEEGIALIREGINEIRESVQSKYASFPLQVQFVQYLAIYADLLISQKDSAGADAVLKEMETHVTSIQSKYHEVNWIRGLGVNQRALLLIRQVQDTYRPHLETEVENLEERGRLSGSQLGTVHYNLACVYSMAIPKAPESQKDYYAKLAMQQLKKCNDASGYLQIPTNVSHMDQDTDLDPIRDRPEFVEFRKRINEKLKGS